MFRKTETEVLVAGAGPVGLYTALALENRGIKVRIIDGQWTTTTRSYALALHPRSLELLAEIGVAEELFARGHRLDRVAFYDRGERVGELSFSALDAPFPFALVLPQQALEEILAKRLEKSDAKVLWHHRLSGVTVQGEKIEAKIARLVKDSMGYAVSTTGWVVGGVLDTKADFLLGADGHNSMVRRGLGIDLTALGPAELYGVFEVEAAAPDPAEARIFFDGDQLGVLWPLGENRSRWSFQLDESWGAHPSRPQKNRVAVDMGPDAFPLLDRAKLEAMIQTRAPWFDGEIGKIRWSIGVGFEQRLTESFGRGNVWLLGDAAHQALPIGVQSMNVGMCEGHELANRLVRILRGGESRDLLEQYGEERLHEWRRLFGVEPMVSCDADAPTWIRDRAARFPAILPASGEHLRVLLEAIGLREVEPDRAAMAA